MPIVEQVTPEWIAAAPVETAAYLSRGQELMLDLLRQYGYIPQSLRNEIAAWSAGPQGPALSRVRLDAQIQTLNEMAETIQLTYSPETNIPAANVHNLLRSEMERLRRLRNVTS